MHRYAEHPQTRIWVLCYRLDNGPVLAWHPGAPLPADLAEHVAAGRRVVAHNSGFEFVIWNVVLPRYVPDVPRMTVAQMDCTMARAAALGVPQGLDHAAHVLGVPHRKDTEGHAVMLRMARPRKIDDAGGVTWWDDAARLDRLTAYCAQDVLVESAIDERAPALSPSERLVWELDQTINNRGVALDVRAIRMAEAVVDLAKRRLDAEMARITGGAVRKCTEAAKLAEWIAAQGIPCASVAKGEHDELRLLAGMTNNEAVGRAVDLRHAAVKASTAKLVAMTNCVCDDGRARGQLHYHGAFTGRWAGRLIQPQNLHRNDPERDGNDITHAFNILHNARSVADAHDAIDMICGAPMETIAKCLRGMFIAAPGRRFVGGDLSNIEGCVNAWLSGEDWKVEAYRANQAGIGPDLYRVAYVRSFGGDLEAATGNKRQVGKVQELAFQYQGSIGAFLSMARNYGVKPRDVVPIVRAATPPEVWDAALRRFDKTAAAARHGLPREEWAAVRIVVDRWRAAHPAIVAGWWELQDAAIAAVASPGDIVPVFDGRVRYVEARGFLWCALPSNRVLAYKSPRLREVKERWLQFADGTRADADDFTAAEVSALVRQGEADVKERTRRRVDYEGFDSATKRWGTFSLYGGLQDENIVQAIARDLMVEGMLAAEAHGYPIVLTVHDEILTEPPVGHGSAADLRRLMSTAPPWADGLPLAAKCWEDARYAK